MDQFPELFIATSLVSVRAWLRSCPLVNGPEPFRKSIEPLRTCKHLQENRQRNIFFFTELLLESELDIASDGFSPGS